MANNDQCIIATLLRGRVYIYKGVRFERDVPVLIEDETLAEELAADGIETIDSQGDLILKPRFDIDFEASRSAYNDYLAEEARKLRMTERKARTMQTSANPAKRFRLADKTGAKDKASPAPVRKKLTPEAATEKEEAPTRRIRARLKPSATKAS